MAYPAVVRWANTDSPDVVAKKLHDEVRYLVGCAYQDGRSMIGVLTARDLGRAVEIPSAVPPRTEFESLLEFEPF